MYIDKSIGELIRSLRKDKGFTQDALSMDLCSTQSISRIENASQNPSGEMIRRLLERLGEPGFFRGFYYERDYLKALDVKISIIESFETRDIDRYERGMFLYEEEHNPNNKSEVQFYQFIKLLYYELLDGGEGNSPEEYEKLIRLSHPGFRVENVSEYLYEHTEFLIMNSLARAYINRGNYRIAENIIKCLLKSVGGSRHFLPSFWKTKAGLFNNLAVCQYRKGNNKGAVLALDEAFRYLHFDVGILFIISLLRSKIYIDNKNSKNQCYYLLQVCYHNFLNPEIKKNINLEDYLRETCYLSII